VLLLSSGDARMTTDTTATSDFDAPKLDDVQRRVVDSLRAEGIAVIHFDELFDGLLWQELDTDLAPFIRNSEEVFRNAGDRPASKAEIIARRFYVKKKDKHVFPIDGPWLRFAASEKLVDIANAFRGLRTKLFYLDNWFTVPYAGADERIVSQRWHRDSDDEYVLKVFTYFSDVDQDAGPFEYIRSSAPNGKYGAVFPWPEGEHPPQDELAAAVDSDDMLTLTGPKGTMIFAVTSGFHRGGFARLKPRVLSVCSYLAPDAPKRGHRFAVDFAGREAEVPAQVQFALR
jgi:hypothetical protein